MTSKPSSQPLRVYLKALGPLISRSVSDPNALVAGATNDSRQVQPGWLFVGIPGFKDDGTRYVQDAVARGAAAVVTATPVAVPATVGSIQVRDAYAAAGLVADVLYGFPAEGLCLVGVTGTNGKTTCAYLLRDLLARSGRRVGMIGTVQYEIAGRALPADRTTPPAFELQAILCQMRDAGVDSVVMEVSSHALDQHRPGSARFAGALFTNLTGDHLDYHRTMDGYYAAKKRLFSEYLTENAPAVVCADDEYGRRLLQELPPRSRLVGFGRGQAAAARISEETNSWTGSTFTLTLPDRRSLSVRSPLLGAYNVANVAGAATLGCELGLDLVLVRDVVEDFTGAPGRLQPVRARNGMIAFVDYAHTDDALRNVLTALRGLKPERLLVVFGCGGDRDRTKRPRMGRAAAELADRLYLTSDNPRSEDPEAIIAEVRTGIPAGTSCLEIVDRRAAIRAAVAEARPSDLLVIAGKGHEDYQEQKGRKTPFSDVEEVRAAMAACGLL